MKNIRKKHSAHQHTGVAQGQQTFFVARHRHGVIGVQVHHYVCIIASGVDRRMDREAGGIDEIGRLLNNIAVKVDFDER